MPRKSAASLAVALPAIADRRVKPPADLPAPAKALWVELVDSLPADRFHRSDVPLLALYCRALSQANEAFAMLEKHGAAAGSAQSPWVKIADASVKQASGLAIRLRLCPQSRLDRKVAGPAARPGPAGPAPWEDDAA